MTTKIDENSRDSTSLPRKMVHELNNIVFVLQGNLEMLLEDLQEDHPCRDFAAEALKATMRAKTLLADPLTSDCEPTELRRELRQAAVEPGRGPLSDAVRVLLVDDDPMLLDALNRGLMNLGFRVRDCADPRQALDLVRADPRSFDVVVSDLIMPQMTGQELAEQILNTRKDLPIILMSGYQGETGREITAQSGISLVLPKPLRFIELAAAIANCVDSNTGK